MNDDDFTFEILCIDSDNISKIRTAEHLAHSLLSNADLWVLDAPSLDSKQHRIEDRDLSLTINSIDAQGAPDFVPQKAFGIKAEGKFDPLERFRIPLVAHVKKQDIGLVYVLWDAISKDIASDIYPWINHVENRLRGYLIKFFVTKLGPDWWRLTADAEMQKKVQQRRNNERIFSQHVDNKAYLIDFGELGKIVYAQSSGFLDKEDIIERVMKLEHTPGALGQLQQDLQSNYTKFFKETFKDKGFQDMWVRLEEIRHKVAHNNLFTLEDRTRADQLTDSLIAIIDEGEEGIDQVVFSTGEQVAIQEAIIDSLSQPSAPSYDYVPIYTPIEEEDLLRELARQERYSDFRGGYVGLAHFVKVHLGNQGYDYATSYNVIDDLAGRGIVEIYNTTSLAGFPARGIRRTGGKRDDRGNEPAEPLQPEKTEPIPELKEVQHS